MHSSKSASLHRTSVALIVLASLMTACGGGGGSGSIDPNASKLTSITGKIIDGYIQGATACLDLNLNNTCDSSEPSTVSDATGSYTLSAGSDVVIENIPVVVNVPAGAIDQSDGTVAKGYTLKAPSTKALVISPFTTLAMYKIQFTPGMTYGQAAQAVAEKLMATGAGATFDPAQDFIAAGNTAMQNAARATVALLQAAPLNKAQSDTNLQAFLDVAENHSKFGYANPTASFKSIQQDVSQSLQSLLSVGTLSTGSIFVSSPTALSADSLGNVYTIDGTRILKTATATGTTSTIATGLSSPSSIAADKSGTLYVTDLNTILKISNTGALTTFAGSADAGSADGTLGSARFNGPKGIAISPDGMLYVADTGNSLIRKIDPVGSTVTTIDLSSFATSTLLPTDQVLRITATNSGVYFAAQRGIFKWDGTHLSSYTFANSTFVGALAADAAGGIYFTDTLRAKVFKLMDQPVMAAASSPFITAQIAGNQSAGAVDGPASSATFALPMTGLTVGSNGTIYVSDTGNRKVRSIQ